jgi:hypothetical protein
MFVEKIWDMKYQTDAESNKRKGGEPGRKSDRSVVAGVFRGFPDSLRNRAGG